MSVILIGIPSVACVLLMVQVAETTRELEDARNEIEELRWKLANDTHPALRRCDPWES